MPRPSTSLAQIEEAFVEQTHADRRARVAVERTVAKRARRREMDRHHRRGSVRYVGLCLAILATAVLVTVAMFETLYHVMA